MSITRISCTASKAVFCTAAVLWLIQVGSVSRAGDLFSSLPDPTRVDLPMKSKISNNNNHKPLVLQSTLISGKRRLAIINGRTVGVGDRVKHMTVVDILANEVVLRRGHRILRLALLTGDGIKAHAEPKELSNASVD